MSSYCLPSTTAPTSSLYTLLAAEDTPPHDRKAFRVDYSVTPNICTSPPETMLATTRPPKCFIKGQRSCHASHTTAATAQFAPASTRTQDTPALLAESQSLAIANSAEPFLTRSEAEGIAVSYSPCQHLLPHEGCYWIKWTNRILAMVSGVR